MKLQLRWKFVIQRISITYAMRFLQTSPQQSISSAQLRRKRLVLQEIFVWVLFAKSKILTVPHFVPLYSFGTQFVHSALFSFNPKGCVEKCISFCYTPFFDIIKNWFTNITIKIIFIWPFSILNRLISESFHKGERRSWFVRTVRAEI